jgi:hypothetical protein
MTTQRELTRSRPMASSGGGAAVIALCVADAALLVASGWIHLHLWRGPYRHLTVGHINTLFLLQWIAAFVAAAAVLVVRHFIVALGAAALMAGTFIGFLISRYRSAGLFGWHDPVSTNYSDWALVVEIAGTVLLLATAALMVRGSRSRA